MIHAKVNIAPDRYSYQDCIKYEELMSHHLKRMVKQGISADGKINQGYPIMKHDDEVPTNVVYLLNPMRNSRPRATKTHSSLPYLRQHAVNATVIRMKDACLYPVKMKGDTNWNNFPQYLYTFHVHYCDLEGLDMSNDLAYKVLLYLFYGTYKQKSKIFPIIRCLHYKTIQGRHRFGKYAADHFVKFIEAINEKPEWTKFFDDLGKGDAPIEYLVLVEIGLRSFGSDLHAMGSRAMDSQERWFAVSVWRKREAYIAVIRFIRKHLSYPQWDCYRLEDYSERQSLNKTFLVRHFPLSNGVDNRLDGHLEQPAQWSDPPSDPDPDTPTPSKRVKREPKLKRNAAASAAATSAKPMVWDVDNNCFVAY